MSTLYFAFSPGGEARRTYRHVGKWAPEDQPSFLVSFWYLKEFESIQRLSGLKPRHLILDSGAFSAWNCGAQIDIQELIKESNNPRWEESVALDVIGDGVGSLQNALVMKHAGSAAYPVFHIGEDFDLLKTYCKEFSKVGLSCRFGEPLKESIKWLHKCFSRCYPHPFHSFGCAAESVLKEFPFHSADTASWAVGPAVHGRWKAFGGACSVRGATNLEAEVRNYLKFERFLQARWKKELSRWPVVIGRKLTGSVTPKVTSPHPVTKAKKLK